jgi:lipopolysaccharide/colanic/teichoic acid biosynthesis glycosyltransferase
MAHFNLLHLPALIRRFIDGSSRPGKALPGLLSAEEFAAVLDREKLRTERSGSPFVVVVFDVDCAGRRGLREQVLAGLGIILRDHGRASDTRGFYRDASRTKLGLLMPDSLPEKTSRVIEAVRRDFLRRRNEWLPRTAELSWEVLRYPPDGIEHGGRFEEANLGSYRLSGLKTQEAGGSSVLKRAVDVLGASMLLLILAPLFLLVALAIKLASRGPVFFRQERVGPGGGTFAMLKFRTMAHNSDSECHRRHVEALAISEVPMTKLEHDPRIFKVGRFLRKYYIDELPQLVNVVWGEMSLVGPRPDVTYSVRHYKLWQRRRLLAAPGMTGSWQVSGKNATTLSGMARLDIAYARNRSLWLDLMILLKTLPVVIYGEVQAKRSR